MEDAEQWKEAIGTELQALIDMGTWKLVPLANLYFFATESASQAMPC